MRIAIIADIHSNFPALEAVMADIENQGVDEVIVAGDALNGGPCPRQVIDTIYEHRWEMVLGNHEGYILETQDPPELQKYPPEWGTSHWTVRSLDTHAIGFLRQLPIALFREDLAIFHAAHDNLFTGVMPHMTDEEIAPLFAGVEQSYIVTAHTHLPLVRQWHDKVIINPGSVGMSLDGNPMPSYVILTRLPNRFIIQHRRVAYDIRRLEHFMHASSILDEARPFAHAFFRQMQTGRAYLPTLIRGVEAQHKAGVNLVEALRQVDVDAIQPDMGYGATRPSSKD